MTEIPEHLLKRAQQAREKAEAEATPAAPATPAASETSATSEPASDPRIPAHLLERSRAAKAKTEGSDGGDSGGGGAVGVQERVASGCSAGPPAGGVPVGSGPGGHTQRLLTVVKSGSIQDVKASPVDKV